MTQIFIYNKEKNVITEKATFSEPKLHNYKSHPDSFVEDLKAYNQHIASLKEYPCSSGCGEVWQDKQELIQKKDFHLWFDMDGKHGIANPIKKRELKEDEDKLWMELESYYRDLFTENIPFSERVRLRSEMKAKFKIQSKN